MRMPLESLYGGSSGSKAVRAQARKRQRLDAGEQRSLHALRTKLGIQNVQQKRETQVDKLTSDLSRRIAAVAFGQWASGVGGGREVEDVACFTTARGKVETYAKRRKTDRQASVERFAFTHVTPTQCLANRCFDLTFVLQLFCSSLCSLGLLRSLA